MRCRLSTPGSARRASLRPASGPSSLALCSRAAQERPTRWSPWVLAPSASPARKWRRTARAGSCTTRTPRCAHGAVCCSTSSTSSSSPPPGRSSPSLSPPTAVAICCARARAYTCTPRSRRAATPPSSKRSLTASRQWARPTLTHRPGRSASGWRLTPRPTARALGRRRRRSARRRPRAVGWRASSAWCARSRVGASGPAACLALTSWRGGCA